MMKTTRQCEPLGYECRLGKAKYPVKGNQKYENKFVVKRCFDYERKHIVFNHAFDSMTDAMGTYLLLCKKRTPQYNQLVVYNNI